MNVDRRYLENEYKEYLKINGFNPEKMVIQSYINSYIDWLEDKAILYYIEEEKIKDREEERDRCYECEGME